MDEQAYIWAAVASQSIEPCKKIGDSSITKAAFNTAGYQVESLQSRCFRAVAILTGNEQLCEHANPVSRLRSPLLDGSKYSPKNCRENVSNKRSIYPILMPGQATHLMLSLQYSDETIFNECSTHFSTQKTNIGDLKNKYHKQYDVCIEREKRAGGGLEKNSPIHEAPEERRQFCHQRTLSLIGVKDYYFGKPADKYPNDRRYGYCENYCVINEFEGDCKKTDEQISEEIYTKFLASQARFGELLQRLQLMPNH